MFLSCSDLFPLVLIQRAEPSVTWTRAFASAPFLGVACEDRSLSPAHPRAVFGATEFGGCPSTAWITDYHQNTVQSQPSGGPDPWRCPNPALRRRSTVRITLYFHGLAPRFCRPSNTLRCNHPNVNPHRKFTIKVRLRHPSSAGAGDFFSSCPAGYSCEKSSTGLILPEMKGSYSRRLLASPRIWRSARSSAGSRHNFHLRSREPRKHPGESP